MIERNEHLKQQVISAFIDHELGPDELGAVQQHLADCHPCSLNVLWATRMKIATAAAGQRFAPSPEVLARLAAVARAQAPQIQQKATAARVPGPWVWSAVAALLLLAILFNAEGRRREANSLSAELLDQHLATLSSFSLPEVLSTDKHTVKPWFQGKLPFSFNLPDPAALPQDTLMKGADFTYLHAQPAALLLFTIHKHEVSVFLTQRGAGASPSMSRSGFTIRTAVTKNLRFIAVSDVDAKDLSLLVWSLVRAQDESATQ